MDSTAQAKEDLVAIIALIASGSAPTTSSTLNINPKKGQRPDLNSPYVSDLPPEDIPSETREVITSEIAVFRERARKLELEKREAEARKTAAQGESYRQQIRQTELNNEGRNGSRFGHPSVDPQSYNKPVQFHAAGSVATVIKKEGRPDGKVETKPLVPVIDPEQKERNRLEKVQLDRKREFEDVSYTFARTLIWKLTDHVLSERGD